MENDIDFFTKHEQYFLHQIKHPILKLRILKFFHKICFLVWSAQGSVTFNKLVSMEIILIFSQNTNNVLFVKSNTQSRKLRILIFFQKNCFLFWSAQGCEIFNDWIITEITLIFLQNTKNILYIRSNTQSWNYESCSFSSENKFV